MNLSKLFPANRVAAIASWIAGLAAFIAGITQTLPHSWQNTALAISGILAKVLVSLHFMTGSQKVDSATVAATSASASAPPATDNTVEKLRAQVVAAGMIPVA